MKTTRPTPFLLDSVTPRVIFSEEENTTAAKRITLSPERALDTNKKPRLIAPIQPALGIEEAWRKMTLDPPQEPKQKKLYVRFKYLLTKEMKKVYGTKLTAVEASNAWNQVSDTISTTTTVQGEENQPNPYKQNLNYHVWLDCKLRAQQEEKDQGDQFAMAVEVWKKHVMAGMEVFLQHVLGAKESSQGFWIPFQQGIEKAEEILPSIQEPPQLLSLLADAKQHLCTVVEDFLRSLLSTDDAACTNLASVRRGIEQVAQLLPRIKNPAPESLVCLLEDATQKLLGMEKFLSRDLEAFLQHVLATENPASIDMTGVRQGIDNVAKILLSIQAPAGLHSLLVDAKQKLRVLEKRQWVAKKVEFFKTASDEELIQEAWKQYEDLSLQMKSQMRAQEELYKATEIAGILKGTITKFFQKSLVYDDMLQVRSKVITYSLPGVTKFIFEKAFGPVQNRYETTLQSTEIGFLKLSTSARLVFNGPILISLKKGNIGDGIMLVASGLLALQVQTHKDGNWNCKVDPGDETIDKW